MRFLHIQWRSAVATLAALSFLAASQAGDAPEPAAQTQPPIYSGDTTPAPSALPAKPPERSLDASADPIKIAFISYANPQQVAKDSDSVCQYLQKYLGVPVKGFVTLDYGSSIEAMRNEQADLAFVDPLAFMMAHEQMGAVPLLLEIYGSGKPVYRSNIWVRKDSGVSTLEDLRGKIIAFADQVDMSGHLMPRDIIVRAGLAKDPRAASESFFGKVYFAGGDEQAIRAMFNGFTDAAGVSQYAIDLLRVEEREQVTSIASSIESPSHLLMARPGLSDEMVSIIKTSLRSLDRRLPADRELLGKLYGTIGYAEASLGDFNEVAKIAAASGFVKNPGAFDSAAPAPTQ